LEAPEVADYSPSFTRLGKLPAPLPVRAGNSAKHGFRPTYPETPPMRLFPLERVLDAADSILDLSGRLVSLALGLHLGIAKYLAGDFLDFAYDPFFRSFDPIFVHEMFSKM